MYISAGYVNDDRNFVEATKETLKLYDGSMIGFEGRIIHAGEPVVSPVPKTIPLEFKTRLKNNLFNSKREEAKKLLMNYFAEMVNQGISWKGARHLVSIFENIFSEIAEEGHVDVSQEVGLLFGQINEFADEIGIGCMLNYLYQAVDIFIEKAGNHHVDKTILKNQFIQYIESNYRKELYLEMAAEHFHLTAKYFSAKFKDITGDNFYEYLTRFRVKESKVLLRNSSHRVNEISEMTGFSNVNAYIRHFKRYEGVTPKAFREMNINRADNQFS